MEYLLLGLALAAGYLIGAVPFGWLVARSRGVDILRQGSGNIGATNVGRVLGMRFGALVFVLDFAKGALPVLAASLLPEQGLPHDSLRVAAGVAAFLGHLFPVYLGFHGGKGVATGVGVVAVLLPLLALLVLAAWVVMLAASRYVSLASLTAAALLSALRLALTPHPWSEDHRVATAFCLFGTVLVFVRHAGNVRRLLHGSEHRQQDSPAMLLFSKTVHVLALGLWFGTAVFFTVVGLLLFQTFDDIGVRDAGHRPAWFPLPEAYTKAPPSDKFPNPLRKEQGSARCRRRRGADLPLVLRHPGGLRRGGCDHGTGVVVHAARVAGPCDPGRAARAGADRRRPGVVDGRRRRRPAAAARRADGQGSSE